MGKKRRLTLYCPGLRAPLPEGCMAPRLPGLETLLARAGEGREPVEGFEAGVFSLFGLPLSDEPPVAALSLLGEGEAPGEAFWLRADPVHLAADRDRLYLGLHADLPIEVDEAVELVAELNRLLAEDGLQLLVLTPHRWYLRLPQSTAISTAPLSRVMGQHIDPFLPTGEDALRWHKLLTELQMVLHASRVNQEREQHGLPAINSLWLWGAGRLPDAVECLWSCVWSGEPLSKGAAALAGCRWRSLPQTAVEWLRQDEEGSGLLVWDALHVARQRVDPRERIRALHDLEQQWAGPLLGALRDGRLERLALVDDDGRRYVIGRNSLRRFWRRAKPLFSS